MSDLPGQPIPVTVVTGFLGAGKTTLINRLITSADAAGLRLGLIVNDFGSINLDASELSQSGSTVLALEGGCVCCSLSAGLVSAILALTDSSQKVEHILIEASGISDPLGIVMPLVGAGLHRVVRLAAVVTVVDVGQVGNWPSEDSESLAEAQVRGASAVVFSKTSLHGTEARSSAQDWVASLAPSARLLDGDTLAPELLLDTNQDVLAGLLDPAERARDEARHLDAFDTWVLETDRPFVSLAELRKRLADLPNEVVRAKGVVSVADSKFPVRFHLVGRILSTRFVESPADNISAGSASKMAVLGAANTLDVTLLDKHFDSALLAKGEEYA